MKNRKGKGIEVATGTKNTNYPQIFTLLGCTIEGQGELLERKSLP